MNHLAARNFLGFALTAMGFCWAGCRPTTQTVSGTVANPSPPVAPVSASAEKSPIRFTDRAAAAGLNITPIAPQKPPRTILQVTGCGCAFLDYDGDGWLDIVIVGQPRPALFRNRGDGTFENVTQRVGMNAEGTFMGVAVGDLDNDGRPDILLTGYGKNALYSNRPTGFVDITARAGLAARSANDWATSAAFADLDGDGKLDLLVGHYVTFSPQTRQLCKFGEVEASCPPFYYEPQTLQAFRGHGNGTFTEVTRAWGMAAGHGNNLGIVCADFDDDGWLDIYVANDGLPADLWRNLGKGRFENIGALSGTAYDDSGKEQAGMGVDCADYDHDGRLDLLVTTFQNQPRALYRNLGKGMFRFVSTESGLAMPTVNRLGFGVAFADFDGDGWADILLANGHVQDTIAEFQPPATYAQTLQCFRNRSDGTFAEVSGESGEAFARPIVGRGLAVGDFDNDGRPDALVVDLEGRPLLLHNESPPSHWLGIRLIGRQGGREAIGTRLILESPLGRQTAEVGTGRSYLSASDPRVLFGLGTRPLSGQITLTVIWKGGHRQKMAVDSVNRYLVLQEPSSP